MISQSVKHLSLIVPLLLRAAILLLCLWPSTVEAQNHSADSLQHLLGTAIDDTTRINALLDLAVEFEKEDRARSFELTKEALELSEKAGSPDHKGRCLNYLGDLYWFASDYTNASSNYFKALAIYEKENDQVEMGRCYRNIGWIYQGQGNYEQTLLYYNKSLEINKRLGLKQNLIANYDDLGILYKMMGKLPEALEKCKMTIQLSKEINSAHGIATAYGNLGSIYFEMKQYDLAIESYRYSVHAHKSHGDFYNMAVATLGIADCYLIMNKPEKAIAATENALSIAKLHGFRKEAASSYKKLATAHRILKDHKNAYEYLRLFQEVQDSVYNEQNSRQINEMSVKYESEKKELLIDGLQKDRSLSEQKLEKAKTFQIYAILFCLLIAGIAFAIIRGYLRKKKTNEALSQAYTLIGIKNKDITDSINYSKRIQEASLPPKELKFTLFPDSFVYYCPKDIVSGDFYWYAEKNGKKLIAACDCTGHGVPGALMSMIGNNLLNQIVNEKGITDPALILDQLHVEIRKALKQEEHAENRDGMDIALITFLNENEAEFAGAQRPLWILRNNELSEIKGNKFSIGGLQTEESRRFAKHHVTLEKNDCLYIFTDGFVDQFGGDQGKKFMSRNFKQLLLNLCTEPMAMQELVISQTFEKWKNKREQVDDVLVIGIRKMKQRALIFLCIMSFLGWHRLAAQDTRKVDSLQKVVSSSLPDSIRTSALINLSFAYQGYDAKKAFDIGMQALQLAKKSGNKKSLASSYNNLGDLYWYKSDYTSASKQYLEALYIMEKTGDSLAIAECYRNIGWVYFKSNNFALTSDYYHKALDINLKLGNKRGISQNYNDLAILHIHQKQYREAIVLLEKCLVLEKELGRQAGLISHYGNLGIAYDELGETEKAIQAIERSISIAEETGNKQHLAIAYCNLGTFYSKLRKFDLAEASLKKSIFHGEELGFIDVTRDSYLSLAKLNAERNNYEKAYEYKEKASHLSDTIYNNNNSRQVNEMTAKYESEKKELLISALEKSRALQAGELEKDKMLKIGLGITSVLIIIVAFIFYRGNIQKKKANDALSQAYQELEEKNKDVTDSINYSQRIQDATLPAKELKHKLFPEAFVLFSPKDIVSGDFYWYAEKNGKRLIAACDCTGHGVPGALMSMIGNNLLNQIVNESEITEPARILDNLHMAIRKSLKQEEQKDNNDGMDIAMISFNGEREIEFAGAQRPLWILRNKEIIEIKGNKYSIGGMQNEQHRTFSPVKVALEKNDILYLFTDGYVDQFGGKEGKKFMTKNLKELLLRISGLSMAEQEVELRANINSWMGNREQVDDILVIGIRIS
jgi:serine phosphatase RsbU (regulator of sigma subunit)/Tfp pilus assembly protein PilF